MRQIEAKDIIQAVKEMCIEATHFLTKDMVSAMNDACEKECSPVGKQVLEQLQDNLKCLNNLGFSEDELIEIDRILE